MKINLQRFNDLVKDKYISVQKHPTAPLLIWNYSQKCQFERFWTEETMMARGLITDLEGNIVARPFKKFFNVAEHTGEDSKLPPLPLEDFEVTEKMDGSLGILYFDDHKPQLATRGSFISEQAIKGTEIFNEKYNIDNYPDFTYLFEIIYPQNRIVVDYGGLEDVCLLAMIETETGYELSLEEIEKLYSGKISLVKKYDGISDIEKLKELARDNAEGFVIRFKSGIRVKVKFDEYIRLHRLVTGVNAKTIWEHLKEGTSLEEMIERVPDEFSKWVLDTTNDLKHAFNEIEFQAEKELERIQDLESRKEQALAIQNFPYKGVVFQMLDKADYSKAIWRMIRPVAERPWKEDIDA